MNFSIFFFQAQGIINNWIFVLLSWTRCYIWDFRFSRRRVRRRLSSGMLRRVVCYKPLIALMMVAASTSETSVNFYQTTRRDIPEDSSLTAILFIFNFSPFSSYHNHHHLLSLLILLRRFSMPSFLLMELVIQVCGINEHKTMVCGLPGCDTVVLYIRLTKECRRRISETLPCWLVT
jgi:hypothetical protein